MDINSAHLHLMLVHIPVVAFLLSAFVLVGALLRPRDDGWLNAGLLLIGIGAIGALLAYLAGEGAEEIVEKLPGINEAWIHRHEERATISFALGLALGAYAAGLAVAANKLSLKTKRLAALVLLLLNLVVAGFFAWTADAGGDIRHSEIRSQADIRNVQNAEDEHDHDD